MDNLISSGQKGNQNLGTSDSHNIYNVDSHLNYTYIPETKDILEVFSRYSGNLFWYWQPWWILVPKGECMKNLKLHKVA